MTSLHSEPSTVREWPHTWLRPTKASLTLARIRSRNRRNDPQYYGVSSRDILVERSLSRRQGDAYCLRHAQSFIIVT